MTIVRQATVADLDALVPLFDAYRVFYKKSSDEIGARTFLEARLIQNESIVYIAYDNDEPLGFTQLYPLFSSTRMKRMWLLNDLFVTKRARGRGISKQLIDAAKALAIESNACGVSLETEKSNMIGNQLYPHTGFELDNDHNFYFWSV